MAQISPGIVLKQSGVMLELRGDKYIKSAVTLSLFEKSLSFLFANGDNLDMPLCEIENFEFYQPIFGASYISALWAGVGKFSATFKEGGGAYCFEKLSEFARNAIGDNMLTQTQGQTISHSKKTQ